ncbi:MAG: HAD family phosphatase [Ruminococcus sp.]|nr:HAD family phosphatase [Ruminococcus sp.]
MSDRCVRFSDDPQRLAGRLRGAVFDMDGLMVDTESLLTRFWREAAAFYGFDMTKEHVLGIRSLAARFAAPQLRAQLGEDFDYQLVRKKRIELMNAFIEENGIEKKPGLDELIDRLKAEGWLIAVATATDFQRTKMYLSSVGVFDKFDKVICGDMVKNGKPAPDIYLTAARELGLPPGECVAFEDSPNGIRSAYDAGCLPIMIPDMSEPDEETCSLLYAKCRTLADVIELL